MHYSTETRDRRYVKGYRFLSFPRNIGKNIGKNISNKYRATKVATYAIKTASKRAVQKTAEATGDLVGNNMLIRLRVYQTNLQKNCPQRSCTQMKLIMKYQ